jgi:HK97 family phage prohead protease
MAKKGSYDFSGYATRVGLKCTDGRTILPDAFQDNDGQTVPLVWQHLHNEPSNILGHAVLENRKDGVYAYCSFNESPAAQDAKEAIKHGDIKALSIYANSLVEKAKNVVHGVIREVSLVIAGANAGAYIDNIAFQHGDGSIVEDETEAIISSQDELEIYHAENKTDSEEKDAADDPTVAEIFDTFNDQQKIVVYAMIAEAMKQASELQNEDEEEETTEVKQTSIEGDSDMKKNVFDKSVTEGENLMHKLTRDELREILADAQRSQASLKNAFLAHGFDSIQDAYMAYEGNEEDKALQHSITDIGYLFPDGYRGTSPTPQFLSRRMEWVGKIFGAAKHVPFSKIKTLVADLTPETARAMGYVKGNEKAEEVIAILKRTTDPQTVYKKQKIDRYDLIDITDFDVIVWLRNEMRVMLEEEIARAMLHSDGRSVASDDKIIETKIRPIALDAALYAVPVNVEATGANTAPTTAELIDAIVMGRKDYQGSGTPTFFTTPDILSNMLLLKDTTGRRLYQNESDLAAALRVKEVVEVPTMDAFPNPSTAVFAKSWLAGVVVNMADYSLGADKGGALTMMDDFDIDYNQYKYLIETRISGALTVPHSALVIWTEDTSV